MHAGQKNRLGKKHDELIGIPVTTTNIVGVQIKTGVQPSLACPPRDGSRIHPAVLDLGLLDGFLPVWVVAGRAGGTFILQVGVEVGRGRLHTNIEAE